MQLFSENKRFPGNKRLLQPQVCLEIHCVRVCSDLKPLLDTLGLYFQIRDDYANLYSEEVKYCVLE